MSGNQYWEQIAPNVSTLLVFAVASGSEEFKIKIPREAMQQIDQAMLVINDLVMQYTDKKIASNINKILKETRDEIVDKYGVESALSVLSFVKKSLG